MTLDRIRGLDGLRAIAVLLVFGIHANWPGFKGGSVGVDMFFVLSGFLITLHLAKEHDQSGQISLSRFYWRRFLRLAPALLVMVAVFAGAWAVAFGAQGLLSREVLPAVLYYSNWTRALTPDSYPLMFGHTWSLAIEEQFYLLWPLALAVILRNKQQAFAVIVCAILACCLWRVALLLSGASMMRVYNGLDTRLDALLFGAAIVFAPARLLQIVAKAWPAAIAVLVLCVIYSRSQQMWLYYVGLPMIALSAAILMAKLLEDQGGTMATALSWRPLAWLGMVSYAFYLWHYPILLAAKKLQLPKFSLLALALSLVAAAVSWVSIERPAQRWRSLFADGNRVAVTYNR